MRAFSSFHFRAKERDDGNAGFVSWPMLVSENRCRGAGIRTFTVAAQRRNFTGLPPTKRDPIVIPYLSLAESIAHCSEGILGFVQTHPPADPQIHPRASQAKQQNSKRRDPVRRCY